MSNKLGVGISENVFLGNVVLDDKLWTTITFKQAQEVEYNAYEALMADDVVDKPKTELDIKLFNLKSPTDKDQKGNTRTQEQKIEMVTRDVNKLKAVYLHIARGYLTKENTKFDYYRATGISSADDFPRLITQQGVLDQITKNLATDFINMVKPFFGNEEHKFRLKLLRQSKDKHFPTLPNQFLDESPFWESMDVPETATKVKFSKYEIDQGLTDPTPTSKASADDKGEPAPEVTAESVFGG